MTQTTINQPVQLHIAGINEELTEIFTEAAVDGITPASILAGIISGTNPISDYVTNSMEKTKLLYEINKEHIRLLEKYPNIQENTILYINRLEGSTPDRYLTILHFINTTLHDDLFRPVYKNTFGKYIKLKYFIDDIRNLIPSKPNLEWKTRKETILDVFGRDLTKLAVDNELPEIVGRDEEVQRMIQILTRQTKSNPILLGDAGVGKTALVEKLAGILIRKEVPHSLIGFRLIELNMAKLLSDPDVENTILALVETAYQEKAILFIDEVHVIQNNNGKISNLLKPAMARGKLKLIGATTHDEYKVFEKDEAIQRRFQPIGVNEPNQAMVYEILKTKADEAEKFHNVLIPKETLLKAIVLSNRYIQNRQQPDKAIDLVEEAASRLRATLESRPQVIVEKEREIADLDINMEIIEVQTKGYASEKQAERIQVLADRREILQTETDKLIEVFAGQSALLIAIIESKEILVNLNKAKDKALHLGDFQSTFEYDTKDIPEMETKIQEQEAELLELASTVDENLIQNVVVPIMVERVIETITGIPVTAQDDDLEKYRFMEVALKKEVHGQDKPIDLMSRAIKRSKAGLADASKPLGSFLCLGPTGVGKTYLAQKLTEFMFDTDRVLKRFDMSEYMESHSVSRMFGSPPGYVGHDEGGQLTETIRRNPYSVILFDEIEKAHPKVFNTLLQVLDSGRMTDGKGIEVNFKNTIIIMTSNIGSNIIHLGLEKGIDPDITEQAVNQELYNHFKPEFLNRFDAKLLFNALAYESVVKIAESEIKKLSDTLSINNELVLHWHPFVAEAITKASYDITDGARPIKRFINDHIVSVITDRIMSGDIVRGDTIYMAALDGVFDVFTVDAEMLATLKDSEKEAIALTTSLDEKKKDKKGKSKKKDKAKSGTIIELQVEEDDFKTELGD